MKTDSEIFALCDLIRETGFALHRFLRNGHLEKVYENGLVHRLRKAGINVEQQYPLQVKDEDGTILGDFVADLLAEQSIVIELKAYKQLCDEHIAQILGYLRACRMVHGLLINFGAPKFEIRKFALSSIES
ncbi:MAG: GxxExxY protein [Kiritimatiellae bacterium]|nr:GxxExxY protein [Kiritimatiellia bacterium]